MKRLIFALIVSSPMTALAVPELSTISGTAGDGLSLTITGTGFGTKTVSKPYIYASFDDGTMNPDSALGERSSWTTEQDIGVTSDDSVTGGYSAVSQPGWADQDVQHVVRVRWLNEQSHGDKFFVSYHWKTSFDGSFANFKNVKMNRFYNSSSNQYPNFYLGQDAGDSSRYINVERCTGYKQSVSSTYAMHTAGAWRLHEALVQLNSAAGVSDGTYKVRSDTDVGPNITGYQFECADAGTPGDFSIQYDFSNLTSEQITQANAEQVYFDAIYVDTTSWNRVYLANAPSLASATKAFVQPFSAWSNTSVTITQVHGTMNSSDTVYAFVCDNSDVCSAGLEVGEGSGTAGGPPPPPGVSTRNGVCLCIRN